MPRRASAIKESVFDRGLRLASNESAYDNRVDGTISEASPGTLATLGVEIEGSTYLESRRNGRPVAVAGYRVIGRSFYVHSVWALEGDTEGLVKLFEKLRARAWRLGHKVIDVQICQERRELVKVLKAETGMRVAMFFCEMPAGSKFPERLEVAPKVLMRRRIPNVLPSSQSAFNLC